MGLLHPGKGPNEELVARLRAEMRGLPGYRETRMFGGVCFVLEAGMICGVDEDDLLLRVDRQQATDALKGKHVVEFKVRGRGVPGFIRVKGASLRARRSLLPWLQLALARTVPVAHHPRKTKRRRK